MAENGTLTPAQRRAITALLSHRNTREAAKAANVAERTMWRWLDEPAFRAELSRQEGAVLEQVTRGLLAMQDKALQELGDLITGYGGNVSAGIRLQAVKAALDIQLRYRELLSLEDRVRKLEEAQSAKNHR